MTDKQQIEEMAKDIEHTGMLDSFSRCEVVAEELHNAGYRKQSGWISVEERLPSECETVIAIVNGRERNIKYINAVMLAEYFSDTNEWALDHNPAVVVSVTHWMPLPEAPKVDGGAE